MDVDEARSDVLAGCVDDASGLRIRERSNGGDASILDANVRGEPRIAGAIEYTAVLDQQVESGGWLGSDRDDERHGEAGGESGNRSHKRHFAGNDCLAR